MESFRDDILTKIDSIVSNLNGEQHSTPEAQLRIEATIINQHNTRQNHSQRFELGTLDISRWRSPTHSPRPGYNASGESSRPSSSLAPAHDELTFPESSTLTETADWGHETEARNRQEAAANEGRPRRKAIGGLRLGGAGNTTPRTPSPAGPRQLATDQRHFPKRRRMDNEGPAKLQPSTIDKLIEGIWEQIHKPHHLIIPHDLSDIVRPLQPAANLSLNFDDVSKRCRVLTGVSRTARSIEVMVQAHWVDCYYARIDALKDQRPELRPHEHKKVVMTEACSTFEWSEKDLRNRLAIWKGYREIKDAAGWAALAFAGPGIYRFCKYRMGFDQEAISKLQALQCRLEVAADTIQPQWRQTLSLVGVSTQRVYRGHPHDWVVSKRKDVVVPLAWTYRQWDPHFSFEQIRSSVIDVEAWGSLDPRRVESGPCHLCSLCSRPQSELAEKNECECFADLFGPNARALCPVQVFSTEDGRNNGVLACCAFARGEPIGEFVGEITKDLEDVDVMQCQGATGQQYQIYQGRKGNFTRQVNHSCTPNAQYQTYVWLGIQRTVLVSKGVPAGKEITVDYSSRYWQRLLKNCLCGSTACRYRDR